MSTTRLLSYLPWFGLVACIEPLGPTPEPSSVLRLEANLDGCATVVEICALTEPPQCHAYCADENPGPTQPDCEPPSDAGEAFFCGDDVCLPVGTDESGLPLWLCGSETDNCSIGYDVATGIETIDCSVPPSDGPSELPPGEGVPPPEGGVEPGDPGAGDPPTP